MYTIENITSITGVRGKDLLETVTGTLLSLASKQVWTGTIVRAAGDGAVLNDAISEALLELDADGHLPMPADLNFVPYAQLGIRKALAQWRRDLKFTHEGDLREIPFADVFTDDEAEEAYELEFLSVADDDEPEWMELFAAEDADVVRMLAAKVPRHEIGEYLGWTGKTPHRHRVQNVLVRVRRQLQQGDS